MRERDREYGGKEEQKRCVSVCLSVRVCESVECGWDMGELRGKEWKGEG